MLAVGKGLKAHGIRGDVKTECYTDTPALFLKIKKLTVDKKEYEIEHARISGNFVLVKFRGIDTMNDAERFRNKEFFAKKSDLPDPGEGRYYIDDVIGCFVYDGEKKIGAMEDILQYGSADVYVMRGIDGKMVMFPYVDGVIEKIDVVEKEIFIIKNGFDKVAVYED